jgi:hypothetical protein
MPHPQPPPPQPRSCTHRYQGGYSPYYNENHKKFRALVRQFVEKEIKPHVDEWIATGYPKELHVKVRGPDPPPHPPPTPRPRSHPACPHTAVQYLAAPPMRVRVCGVGGLGGLGAFLGLRVV